MYVIVIMFFMASSGVVRLLNHGHDGQANSLPTSVIHVAW